ncbi:hypothetical protein M405DRAFT_808216, partial [Rhizopogon salebrosus TDB-379]
VGGRKGSGGDWDRSAPAPKLYGWSPICDQSRPTGFGLENGFGALLGCRWDS